MDAPLLALLLRGDHELNPLKAEGLPEVATPLQFASEAEIRQHIGTGPGSLGPVGLNLPMIADQSAALCSDFVAGANVDGKHLFGINWGRDVALPQVADLRNAQAGDPSPDGQGTLQILRGIEVGHIFQLGDKYSQAMHAVVMDENGQSRAMQMGCYGIGVSRIVAAAIEQHHDDKGIVWPLPLAPWPVVIIPINRHKSPRVAEASDQLYQQLQDSRH